MILIYYNFIKHYEGRLQMGFYLLCSSKHSFVDLLIMRIKADIVHLKRLVSSLAALWASDTANDLHGYLFSGFELYSAARVI
jgi:hypothetical protein